MFETPRMPGTLSLYIGRCFLKNFALVLLVLLGVLLLFEHIELLRRAAKRDDVAYGIVIAMSFLKLPEVGQEMFPFAILASAMLTFWRLTRTNELVVARASGVSVWQFLAPVVAAAMLVGVLQITLVNPAGAILLSRFEALENRHLRGNSSVIEVSRSGLWLREVDDGDASVRIIHAGHIVPRETLVLREVTLFHFTGDGRLKQRLDSGAAWLEDGQWNIAQGWLNRAGHPPERASRMALDTTLTRETIEEQFNSPETLSFWDLPRFIVTLEETGFSAVRARLHFQSLLAQPALFGAMVLVAAVFALRPPRKGGTLIIISAGMVAGLLIFVMNDMVGALGASGAMPLFMAAWMPVFISTSFGLAALLYLEDG